VIYNGIFEELADFLRIDSRRGNNQLERWIFSSDFFEQSKENISV